MEKQSGRRRAQIWHYRRHREFEQELRTAAEKWFKSERATLHPKMKYCLKSHDDWPENIICTNVAAYIQKQCDDKKGKVSFPLHKYIHHGLSSQAMVFNLAGPLIIEKDLKPLKKVVEQVGINWPTGKIEAEFEYDNRNIFKEDSGQPTSIDLVINKNIFIEAKLAEKEFGGCSIFNCGDCDGHNPAPNQFDSCYLHFIGRKYWDLIQEYDFHKTEMFGGKICPLACYYQFYREVLFALASDGCFILLHDDRNPVFHKVNKTGNEAGLWPFLIQSIPAKYRNRIGRITIQRVVNAIEEGGQHNAWIYEFKSKYGLA